LEISPVVIVIVTVMTFTILHRCLCLLFN